MESAAEGDNKANSELVVYTGASCHLCERAKAELDRLVPELGLTVRYVQIDGEPELERAYRLQIPVGFLGGRKVFKYHVDKARLRRAVRHIHAPTC